MHVCMYANRQFRALEEVQDQHRGSAASEAHGLPRRQRAGRHHEGQKRILDHQTRVRRAWTKDIV